MIEVEHLSKIYGSTPAIQDVTFTVEPGEILGFLGPNGAGKTTTMRILAGYLPANSGTAKVAGYEVHEDSMAVRQRIGYLPETPPLYPDMTVEGFLHFVARLKQVRPGDRPERVNWALKRCNLEEKRSVLIRKLSKGFRQRVGIAQAIVHDPPVIILDEPTVGLDPRQIIEVRNLIKSLAGDHTIILSTHILPEVSMTCSRVAIINRGQVVATGSPEELMVQLTGGASYELEGEMAEPLAEVEEGDHFLKTLEELPAVRSAEWVSDQKLPPSRRKIRAIAEPGMEPGPEIITKLVTRGFRVHEMRRTQASLEDLFLQLTTEEIIAESDVESDLVLSGGSVPEDTAQEAIADAEVIEEAETEQEKEGEEN
ncbi:ABC transporter ATP-binding protein [Laspinema olomoucense]|uniref:ABC transporter ATP-binding protein n=1 Tax=Laspinema olomoucense D3b TaxID=2953688 RepID=A0ABT2NEW2_9CYAN|nr:ABC transporter ATP-binding protein [Laspinema sp. D3b]MCT7981248.1 ABC transporter ATP-binding protein [Laspinema sp. D3b]